MEVVHVSVGDFPVFSKGKVGSSVPVLHGVTHIVATDLTFTSEVGDSFMVPFLHGVPSDPDSKSPPNLDIMETVRRSNVYLVKLALKTVPSPGTLILVFSSSTLSLGMGFRSRSGPRPEFSERQLRSMSRDAGLLLSAAEVLGT